MKPVHAFLAASLFSPYLMAQGTFVEPDVTVIRTFSPVGGSFGWAVAELTDINSDGIADLILPSPGTRQVFVNSGADGSLIHLLLPPMTDPTNGFFGNAIGDAGDVDDDGVHDIVIGSPGPALGTNPGHVYVYSGADGSLLLSIPGEAGGDRLGSGVGGAGDVNTDGHDDVVAGANGNDSVGANSGRGYVFSGLDGSVLRTFDAEAAADSLGAGAAGTGDLNGDGIGDQILGAPGAGSAGKAYVYSGADGSLLFETFAQLNGAQYGVFFVAGVGDVNNDGNRDVYVGDYAANGGRGKVYVYSGIDGDPLHLFTGGPGDGMGPGRGAGDVDGDGHADLLIGLYTHSSGAGGAGQVTLRSGRTGAILRTITSTTAGEQLGFDAVGVGDTNGDGFVDLLLSAAAQSRVYLVAGLDHSCPTAAPPLAPVGGGPMNRYIALRPQNAGIDSALRVTLASLHHPDPPNVTSTPPDLSGLEGEIRWVGPPSTCTDSPNHGTSFKCAKLQCSPEFRDWSADLAGATLYVTGSAVAPSSRYDVQAIADGCDVGDEADYSTALTISTARWGDVAAPFQEPSPAGLGQPNVIDIGSQVDKLKDIAAAIIKPHAQLQAADVDPAGNVTIIEVGFTVDAVKGFAYPYGIVQTCP